MANRDLTTKEAIEHYISLIKANDPELYAIKIMLTESRVNPAVLPDLIRALAILFNSSGYGKISVFMQKGKLTQVKVEENVSVNLDAVLLDDK